MKLSKLSVALFVATTSSTTFAESSSLEQVIVTANNTSQTAENITADYQVITAEELEAKHITTVGDALNQVSGISISQNGPLGAQTNIYVRGSNAKRLLVLIDGVRFQDPASSSGADIANLMTSNIERIEIIKGAQSGIWGSDAAAGVINIITKKSDQTDISIEYGSYNTKRASISTSKQFGKLNLGLNAQRTTSDGFSSAAPYDTDIDLYEDDGYTNNNITLKAQLEIDNNQSLALTHNYINAANNYDSSASAPNSLKRSESLTNLTAIHYKNNGSKIAVEQSLFATERLDEGYTDVMNGKTQSIQASQQYGDLLIGLNHTKNTVDIEKPVYTYPAPTYSKTYSHQLVDQYETTSNSAFATYTHQLGSFILNEAIRVDNYSNFDSEITGKIGLKKHVSKNAFITANLGTAYNAPSITQIVNPWGVANTNLQPETSYEASAKYTLHNFSIGMFKKEVQNLIDWESATKQFVNNANTTEIHGYELEYSHSFSEVDIAFNWTRLNTHDDEGKELSRRPEDQLGLNVDWYLSEDIDLNIAGQYIGKRTEDVWGVGLVETGNYSTWDLAVNYQVNKQLSTYLKVNNLFDTYYQTVYNYATAERNINLGLNAKF